ncbi:MAG: hypothetical protein ACPGN3_08650 [Opitutales bacterium]
MLSRNIVFLSLIALSQYGCSYDRASRNTENTHTDGSLPLPVDSKEDESPSILDEPPLEETVLTMSTYKPNNDSPYWEEYATPNTYYPQFWHKNREAGNFPKWKDIPWNDYGDMEITFDDEGLKDIPKAPEPGIHPRIYFGPDQLPELRRRYKETQSGREMWLNLMAYIHAMKGTYDPDADYAQPNRFSGARVDLVRLIGTRTPGNGEIWNSLKSGVYVNPVVDPSARPGHTITRGDIRLGFPLEAFRCLIENDAEGARTLASIIELVVKNERKDIDISQIESKYPVLGSTNLALSYDFIFDWLTPEQKDLFREELVKATHHWAYYGTFLPAYATTHNWTALTRFNLVNLLAIEGEPGFNDLKLAGIHRAFRNNITYGYYPSGACYEGLGKGHTGAIAMYTLAKRGNNLLTHPHLKAYIRKMMPHLKMPYAPSFLGYELWGGTSRSPQIPNPAQEEWKPYPSDIISLKYVFPDDKIIDYIYQQIIGENYRDLSPSPTGWNNGFVEALIFATDYDTDNTSPEVLNELGLSYLAPQRGLMLTRSSFTDPNALFLAMHTRQNYGRHVHGDRNSFVLAGAGRLWARHDTHAFSTRSVSVVSIDDKEQGVRTPGRIVDYADTDLATFMTGDTTYTWKWIWKDRTNQKGGAAHRMSFEAEDGGVPVMETQNDFFFEKGSEAHLSIPFWEYNDVYNADSPYKQMKKPWVDLEYSIRSSGIVRSELPYAIIVDDILVDDQPHEYLWQMQVPWDVSIAHLTETDIFLSGGHDMYSSRTNKRPETGDPLLLIRVLERDNSAAQSRNEPLAKIHVDSSRLEGGDLTSAHFNRSIWKAEADPDRRRPHPKQTDKTLMIPARATKGTFKIFMYPYRYGDPLPETLFNTSTGDLRITIGDRTQDIKFVPSESGKTHIAIHEEGFESMRLTRELPSQPDK